MRAPRLAIVGVVARARARLSRPARQDRCLHVLLPRSLLCTSSSSSSAADDMRKEEQRNGHIALVAAAAAATAAVAVYLSCQRSCNGARSRTGRAARSQCIAERGAASRKLARAHAHALATQ